jgi:uncharacterized protein (DUF2267 family)
MKNIKAINKTLEKVDGSIKTLNSLYHFQDDNQAFVTLRACLKALRDRLTTEEALDLGAQLPALLRGFYFEGWNLHSQHVVRTKEAFLHDVSYHLNGHDGINLEEAVPPTMKVILDMIDQGEAIEVLHQLPKAIQELCPE